MPPWFPDLKECQQCTIGAAYAKSRDSYGGPSKPILACFNQEHYMGKLEAGLAEYRDQAGGAADREWTGRIGRRCRSFR